MRLCDAVLPRLASEYQIGISAASNVVTVFAVAYGVMQFVLGPMGDRFGKLRVIALACGMASLASLACAGASTFGGLLVARLAAGACCACVIPLSMAWIGDVTPYESRQPVLARFLIGQILGLTIGGAAGGLAAEHAYWQWPFLVIAAWFAIAAALLGRAARRQPSGAQAGSGHLFADVAAVLREPWARVVVATVFLEGVTLLGALAFIATHLHFERGSSLALAGLILTAFGAGGFAFAAIAPSAVRRLGEPGLAVAGTLLMALALVAIAWVPLLAAAPFACFAAGLGFYMFHNTLQTNATQMAPRRRGAAVALFASLFFLGQSIGVAIAGWFVERAGTSLVITGAAFAVLPVGFAFAALRRSRRA
jgi:predicted MFS family arabinose efflux permease